MSDRRMMSLGGRLARWARATWSWLRARPLTASLALLVLLASLAVIASRSSEGGAPNPAILALSTGHGQLADHGRWWTLATWWLPTGTVRQLLVGLAVILGLGGIVERRAPRLALLAGLGVGVVGGAAIGAGLQQLGLDTGFVLLSQGSTSLIYDPPSAGIAIALAGSAWLRPVTRLRLRSLTIVACLMPVIYIGHPNDLVRLATALVALGAGAALHALAVRAGARDASSAAPDAAAPAALWRTTSAHERRVLLASSLGIVAVGPLIGVLAAHRHSLASPLISLLAPSLSGAEQLNECSVWHLSQDCVAQQTVIGQLAPGDAVISALPWLIALVAAWGVWRGMRAAAWLGGLFCLSVAALVAFYWFLAPAEPLFGSEADPLAAPAVVAELVVQLVAVVLVHLAVGIALIAMRSACPTRPIRRRVRISAALVGGTMLALAAAYIGMGLLDREAFEPTPSLGQLLLAVPERFLPPALLAHNPEAFGASSDLAVLLTGLMAPITYAVVLACAVWALTRGHRAAETPGDAALRAALRRGSASSLGAMTLWPGYDAWRDEATGALVAYRFEHGVAIALAGPIGAPDARLPELAGIVRRFAAHADERGWIPVLYSAPAELGEALAATGWSLLDVGEESVIPLPEWTTSGKRRQDIRTSMNRAEREGVVVRWCGFDELTVAESKALKRLSEQWAGEKPLPEMGFTLGGYDELDDPDTLLGIAWSKEGELLAATSWLPVWERGELVGRTLDFMRRADGSMNGIMEMLIGAAANRFRDEGLRELSLSAEPLASTQAHAASGSAPGGEVDAADSRALDRVLAELGARLEPLYGFRSLLSFKRKFRPEQRPLVLACPDALALPAIGLALGAAYLPGVGVGQLVRAVRAAGRERREGARS